MDLTIKDRREYPFLSLNPGQTFVKIWDILDNIHTVYIKNTNDRCYDFNTIILREGISAFCHTADNEQCCLVDIISIEVALR